MSLFCLSYLTIVLVAVNPQVNDLIPEYEKELGMGEYSKALSLLNRPIRFSTKYTENQLADVYLEKACFYEEFVGDYEQSLNQIEKILKMPEAGEQRNLAAQGQASRLKKILESKNAIASILQSGGSQEENVEARASELETLVAEHKIKHSAFIAHLYYVLGEFYFNQGENGQATEAFEQALKIKPALYLKYPIAEKKKAAQKKHNYLMGHLLVWCTLGGLLLIFAPLFYLSRPWRWFGPRELVIGGIVFVVFTVFYELLVLVIGNTDTSSFASPGDVAKIGRLPGFEDLIGALYRYGLVAISAALVITSGAMVFKKYWIRLALNTVCCCMLFAAMTGAFYYKYLYSAEVVGVDDSGALDKHFRYTITNPTAHVLSNPAAFPGMKYEQLDEAASKEFIKRHYEMNRKDGEGE